MTIFSCSEITKSFNEKLLFDNIAFGLESGEKLGIIGKNGAGKTTLMKIIAGLVSPDAGNVVFNNNVRFEYLDQLPDFSTEESALDYVLSSNQTLLDLHEKYKILCSSNNENIDELHQITEQIELLDGWNYENDAKKILTQLGITDYFKNITQLSGGLKKRVALARALLSNPDLLILDEPTNHLDADSVQWLQDRLQNSSTSLLFVTHDRYFLDAVSTRILEIDQQKIFSYPGKYQTYLETKENFLKIQEATKIHTLSRLREELAWLQRGARARRTKQKSRIDWVQELANSIKKNEEKKIKIELGNKFLGSRIIEAHSINKSIKNKLLFNNFTYIAKPKDRIGIIGPNGSGKSTLLNVLSGALMPDGGRVEIGASADIGYFHQEIKNLNPTQSVSGALKEVAEYIDVGIGRDRYITVRDLLDKFAFPRYQHTSLISTLSGGERRRLSLCKILMANPNVLLLDEPTNDFDLQTLSALENYLDDFFGVLIIVSHDRSFLDRTVEFIWAFDGLGNIKEYPGNYTNYLEKKEESKKQQRRLNEELSKTIKKSLPAETKITQNNTQNKNNNTNVKKKLSYIEQRELEKLEIEIPELELEKHKLEQELSSINVSEYKILEEKSLALDQLIEKIDSMTYRWLELLEKIE